MLVALAMTALAVGIWRLSGILVIAFGGILFATIFYSMAEPIARRTRLSLGAAVSLIVLLTLAGLVGLAWLVGERLWGELSQLANDLPGAWTRFQGFVADSPFGAATRDLGESIRKHGSSVPQLAGYASTTMGAIANIVLLLFIGVFVAADPQLYARGALLLLPCAARPGTQRAMNASAHALRRWLLGQLILMTCVAVLTGIGISLLRIPLAFSLAVLAGLLEFIPFVGPIAAAVPGILMGFTVDPATAVYAALLYIVIQQVEGNVLQPLIQRWAVALPPALSILSVVVFGVLFGLAGVIFATPLMVVIKVMIQDLYVRTEEASAAG